MATDRGCVPTGKLLARPKRGDEQDAAAGLCARAASATAWAAAKAGTLAVACTVAPAPAAPDHRLRASSNNRSNAKMARFIGCLLCSSYLLDNARHVVYN